MSYVLIKMMLADAHQPGDDPLNAVFKVMRQIHRDYMRGIYTEEEYNEYVEILSGTMNTKWWL